MTYFLNTTSSWLKTLISGLPEVGPSKRMTMTLDKIPHVKWPYRYSNHIKNHEYKRGNIYTLMVIWNFSWIYFINWRKPQGIISFYNRPTYTEKCRAFPSQFKYLFSKFRGTCMNIAYSPATLFHTCSMHLNTGKIKVIEMLFITIYKHHQKLVLLSSTLSISVNILL